LDDQINVLGVYEYAIIHADLGSVKLS